MHFHDLKVKQGGAATQTAQPKPELPEHSKDILTQNIDELSRYVTGRLKCAFSIARIGVSPNEVNITLDKSTMMQVEASDIRNKASGLGLKVIKFNPYGKGAYPNIT